MRGKLFLLIFFAQAIFSLFLAKSASAECVVKNANACNDVKCAYNNTSYCCNTKSECKDLKKNGDKTPPSDTSTESKNKNLWCDGDQAKGLNSAIGCIPILGTKEEFLSFLLRWTVGIGGGIAFILIVYAGFMIMTSQGNPERLRAGQELLTSAISGLILLIFSIFILKVIGVDILEIPGFGT